MMELLIAEQATERAERVIDGLLDQLEREVDHGRKQQIRLRIADVIWTDGAIRALLCKRDEAAG